MKEKMAKDLKVAPEKFWSHVKSRTNTRSTIPSLKRVDGSLASSTEEKAETLNNFFSSVLTNEDLSTVPRTIVQDYPSPQHNHFVITLEIVSKKLQDLDPGKTQGPDGWHPVHLKSIANLIVHPLTILLQKSLDEGVLSADWLKFYLTTTGRCASHQ